MKGWREGGERTSESEEKRKREGNKRVKNISLSLVYSDFFFIFPRHESFFIRGIHRIKLSR